MIFYQNLEDCELSEEEIITVIEREYFVTFMKQLKNRPLKLLVVILCIIYCNSRLKKCFWDLDFSNMLKQGQLVDLMDYQN